jgi:hypothetical protein
MASAPDYFLFTVVTQEILFPDDEPELGWSFEPSFPDYPELSDSLDAGRARRVLWPYARLTCRSSVRGNC